MKAIMVMFDSLNRKMLEPYGCEWVHTPNFTRLAEHAVTFDCNYVGSMPCMPARRELHTGRNNFLHRGWGPMEPFDDSMPEILKNHGIHSRLVSDHQHYWEDGGCTYHTRYSSWDITRGQEGDPWKVLPELLQKPDKETRGLFDLMDKMKKQDAVNRKYIDCEEKMPQAVTFKAGLEFIEANYEADDWFLQIETFDPHEPFFTQEEYKKLYPHEYTGSMTDWPPYYFVTEGEEAVSHVRYEYAALVTMCDRYLGKVLDTMDKYGLWEDTMLIVNTDHGYLLGEHGWWSKTIMPLYEEIARTPLFIYDPRNKVQGVHRDALTQTIDIPATILEFFDIALPKDMQGRSMRRVIESNESIREYALFGFHEAHVNITDGRWVYMKGPEGEGKKDFFEYTLMPTHMRSMFSTSELQNIQLEEPFSFTKGCRTMKIKASQGMTDPANFGTRLYDLLIDPNQEHPIEAIDKETEMASLMIRAMKENDCPKERFERLGFLEDEAITREVVKKLRLAAGKERIPKELSGYQWEKGSVNMYHALMRFISPDKQEQANDLLKNLKEKKITEKELMDLIEILVAEEMKSMVRYFVILNSRTV